MGQVRRFADSNSLCLHITRAGSWILDIMLPKKDGLTALKEIRLQGNHVPVLLLTARDSIEDRVTGLDLGADDYLVKPFAYDELSARSLLRFALKI